MYNARDAHYDSGMKAGREAGIETGIKGMIEMGEECGLSEENIIFNLQTRKFNGVRHQCELLKEKGMNVRWEYCGRKL